VKPKIVDLLHPDKMIKNRKAFLLLSILCLSVFLLTQCFNNQITSTDPRGAGFAGSATCRQCHQSIYDNYIKSTHHITTQPATAESMANRITIAGHRFTFNDSTYMLIQNRDSGLYQAAYRNGKEVEAHRLDIQFGVRHAQTFLYWKNNRTFEHPLSFYTSINNWATSPGFSSTQVNFGRFIGRNCFECHSSFIKTQLNASTAGIEEVLDKNTLIYGIDCERCHGPAINHVNFHNAYPETKEAKYITRLASLTRQQKLDVCAVCHSGNKKMQDRTTFQFKPGDTLSNFFVTWPYEDSTTTFDVHGNQYQLLSQSKCFMNSKTLDCSSCHDPHTNSSKRLQASTSVCTQCHKAVTHKTLTSNAANLSNNCIDCHMPLQPSKAITFQLPGDTLRSAYLLRTHRIAIYEKD
jgi:predicted CXXCH cytochrome family protein